MVGSTIGEPVTPTKTAATELALRVVGSEHDGRIIRLQAPKCTIGSAAGCTLRLKAPGVRDVQCLVVRGPSGLAVRNWAASTRLNGRRFDDAPLAVGDRLSIGPVELEVIDPLAAVAASLPSSKASGPLVDLRQLAEFEQKAKDAQRGREELAKKLSEREKSVVELQRQLSTAEELIAELEQQASAAPAVKPIDEKTLAEIESLKHQAEELAQQFAAAREQWQVERAKLQARIAEEERRVEAVSQAVEQARDEARQQCTTWEEERTQLTADLAAAKQKAANDVERHREAREFEVALTHWRERAEEQQKLIEELQARLEQLPSVETPPHDTADYERMLAELEAGARELDVQAEKLLEREQLLEQLTAALETSQQQLAAERAQFVAEHEAFDLERSQLLSERVAFDAERVQYVADRAALDAERASLLGQREELAREIAELSNAPVSNADVEAIELERSRLALERSALEAEHARVVEEWKAIEAERAALQEEREAIETRSVSEDSSEARRVSEDSSEARRVSEDSSSCSESVPEPAEPFQPQSASEIIAKLSASGLWKDEDIPHDEPEAEAAAPEPAWKALVPAEEQAPPPKPVSAGEEEDSIESYMKRLLQRVSGDDTAPRWTPPSEAASPSASDDAPAPTPSKPTVEAEAFDPKTYVPRSTAPELNANLAAMRELANSSARSAIDTSSKREQLRNAATKLSLSMIAVLTNFALWWVALRSESLLPFFASIMASLCSGAWFVSATAKWLKARREQHQLGQEAE
jgi:hypothetical protein